MASHLGRRKFLATLGSAAAAWPLAARAQQAGKLPTIGFFVAGTPSSHGQWVAAFVQRLRELGWIVHAACLLHGRPRIRIALLRLLTAAYGTRRFRMSAPMSAPGRKAEVLQTSLI
jgi:hypothetical protein